MREWTTSGASSARRRAIDATGGMADDVGALDAQVPQQRQAISGLLGDAERRRHARAAGVAAPVIAHQPGVGRQRRLGAERRVRLGDERAMDEHDRLARAHDLVLQHAPIDTQLLLRSCEIIIRIPSSLMGPGIVLTAR